MRCPPPPHAQIHLPALDASCALILVDVFERAISAVWRAHGDAMAELQTLSRIETPKVPDAVWKSDPVGHHDDCF